MRTGFLGATQREGSWTTALTLGPGSSGRCQLLCVLGVLSIVT